MFDIHIDALVRERLGENYTAKFGFITTTGKPSKFGELEQKYGKPEWPKCKRTISAYALPD
ncbi:hypothetical protein M514_04286 [Trichuris suis]|uniref:Uncharacterized protein n=1 Tax=Trichuris suis TaxID=68888 RepID=A0A085NQH7_9BILA|nr:hypothetical protein M513_04286 [Trichuris suis]KFD71723.1 hypothetical protein M514_04286 [Trichuris suis]